MICPVPSTLKRMKTAIASFVEADAAFKDLERALPRGIDRDEWEEAERHALSLRGEALRIFDIQAEKG